MFAIEVKNLVKEYKNGVRALDELNLSVKQGEIFSLLGPNGAGKSSLINILTTYYKQTSGSIQILGKDLCKNAEWIRKNIACVSQNISIDEHLSLMENMLFQSKIYKVDPSEAKKRIAYLVDKFELSSYIKYPTSAYSGGVKRRLDIAMNMVSAPKILFLDEPTVAMDVESRKALWKMVLDIKNDLGTTIFLTTHYLEEADELSDTICIMKQGKDIVQENLDQLKKYIRQNMVRIVFRDNQGINKYKDTLMQSGIIQFCDIRGKEIFANISDSHNDFRRLNQWILDKGIEIAAIEVVEPTLEDVFLALTSSRKEKVNNYA